MDEDKNNDDLRDNVYDMYLNMIFPFVVIYMSILFGYSILNSLVDSMIVINMVLLTVVTLGFIYGVLAILKELKQYGKLDTLIYWLEKYKKNKDEDSTR